MLELKIDNKYTVIEDLPNRIFKATRYGEEWRNLVGDNLILSMAYRIEELEQENKQIKEAYADRESDIDYYLTTLREIDNHIRADNEPVPYIVQTLKNSLPEYNDTDF